MTELFDVSYAELKITHSVELYRLRKKPSVIVSVGMWSAVMYRKTYLITDVYDASNTRNTNTFPTPADIFRPRRHGFLKK